jgi:hypothetical protein
VLLLLIVIWVLAMILGITTPNFLLIFMAAVLGIMLYERFTKEEKDKEDKDK